MKCPVCEAHKFQFAFRIADRHVLQCSGCGVLAPRTVPGGIASTSRPLLAAENCESLLREEMFLRSVQGTARLVSGANPGAHGEPLGGVGLLDDVLYSEDPFGELVALRARLAVGGVLFLASSLLDFGPLRVPPASWPLWQSGMKFFLRREHLHLLLIKAGYGDVWMCRQRLGRASELSSPAITALFARTLSSVARLALQAGVLDSEGSTLATVFVSAVVKEMPGKPKLSVVMPVFNEHATFQRSIDAVLAKKIEGVDKEVIVVESNSTDGTADLVRGYAQHPEVRLIFQERPRGKGNAVREGLKAASGSFVLIQDADLEYDVDDYDALLEPLIAYEAMFVLGTRHRGDWKLRHFTGAPLASLFFNLGHIFFTGVLNILLRERMSDPFTMYKVFHRDALYGLEFVCNRFDFDHELVIKLVRKGYRPREIPVNYTARSFSEGKKVSVVRDGLTWLWIDLKLRSGPLGPRAH